MAWYEQWFSRDEYEIVYRDRNEEEAVSLVDLIERTVEPIAGSELLDVGCGRGRHAIEFAKRGLQVTGLDLSERSLEIAREKAAEENLNITFIAGDMRNPVGQNRFDGVVNLFTAFGYFEEWDDHQKAVDAMALAVKPGGFVVQDFLNQAAVESNLIPSDTRTIGDIVIDQRRWVEEGRILKEIVFSSEGGSHTFFESVALLERSDFESLYESAGLELETIFGDYSGAPYDDESPRMILFSRKKD